MSSFIQPGTYQRQPENLDLLALLFDPLLDGLNFTGGSGDYLPVSSEKLDSANQKAVVLDHLDLVLSRICPLAERSR